MDLVLDGVSIGPWGGIGGHAYLESRGKAWIDAPHVQHAVASTYDSATVNVSVTIGGNAGAGAVALRVVYVDPSNRTVGQAHAACAASSHCSVPDVALQVIPTPLHVLGRISPIFPPVFSRFLRVVTVSPRRFQRAQNRNPGPRNSVKGAQTPF